MTTQELDTERAEENAHPNEAVPPAEKSWDSLAELALGERPGKGNARDRVLRALRRPTLPVAIGVLVLAAVLVRVLQSREAGRSFPGRDALPAVAIGESVVLEPGGDASNAPEVTVRGSRPALEVILVGVSETDPGVGWKVVVSHPGREIWKSKWERRFERVKDEWRLGFDLDGRDLPEGPLTITLVEAKPKGGEAAAKRQTYRMRVKRRG